MYRKLKRTWYQGYAKHIPNFDKTFPELSHLDSDELCDRFRRLNIDFYCEKKTPVNPWVRLTLPFALVTMLIMFVGLPINFLFTGEWGYSLGKNNRVLNWFRSLRLQ